MHILVELDNVLRDRNDQPIPAGIVLVSTLIVHNQITFASTLDRDRTEQWLSVNKIVNYDDIIDSSVGLVDEDLPKRQINFARSRGMADAYITGNPDLWVYSFDLGIPSMMFGMPSYIRPEFRPDAPKQVRSWDSIVETIERQNTQRANDVRLTRTESLNFE